MLLRFNKKKIFRCEFGTFISSFNTKWDVVFVFGFNKILSYYDLLLLLIQLLKSYSLFYFYWLYSVFYIFTTESAGVTSTIFCSLVWPTSHATFSSGCFTVFSNWAFLTSFGCFIPEIACITGWHMHERESHISFQLFYHKCVPILTSYN